jgi:hypothetical protein
MSTPLISSNLLKSLRKVANRGLQTEVTLMQRQAVEENPYGDDTEEWVTMGEFMGWMKGLSTMRARITGADDVVGSVGVFRLHLESKVVINTGDMVVADGLEYTVQDANLENTYRVYTTAILRRRQ